jgi:hypothetical protein
MMKEMKIKTGMQVEIEFLGLDGVIEHQVLLIVPNQSADYAHHLLGEGTPLAQVLMGRAAGEEVPYPFDDIVSVRIVRVEIVASDTSSNAAGQRETEYRKALADFEKRSAAAFAASFSGKWGDYDPDGIEKWEDEQKPDE